MSEKKSLSVILCFLFIEFYIFVVEALFLYVHVNYDVGFYFIIGAFLITLYYMVISCLPPIPNEEQNKFLKKYDMLRLGWGLVIIFLSIILSLADQILSSITGQLSPGLYALILALYFASLAILIDGILPFKQDLVPIEAQITSLTTTMADLANKQNEIMNKLDSLSNRIERFKR